MRLTSRQRQRHVCRHFEWQDPVRAIVLGKSCCAVEGTNWFSKGSGISFYRFPTEPERRERWMAAVNIKDWAPTNYTWICSKHFVSRSKSDDPLSPNYVPSIFSFVTSPVKRKAADDMKRYKRRKSVGNELTS